jgi:hypothetical protein
MYNYFGVTSFVEKRPRPELRRVVKMRRQGQ